MFIFSSLSGTSVYVAGLCEVPVASVEEAMRVMRRGSDNRSSGKTNMNEHR